MEFYIVEQEEKKIKRGFKKSLRKLRTKGSLIVTALLITITGGVLFYFLGHPALVSGNAEEDAAQRYQDWVDSGSPDYNNSGGGGGGGGSSKPHCTADEVIGQTHDCNGNLYCTRNIHHREDCSTYEGGQYDCHRERGQCGYYGICIPRPCDNNKTCYGACRAFRDNTCNTNNGERDNCYYLGRGDGKGCVPTATSNESCTVDTCWYNRGYACSQELNKCAYVTPWLDINGNTHLNH